MGVEEADVVTHCLTQIEATSTPGTEPALWGSGGACPLRGFIQLLCAVCVLVRSLLIVAAVCCFCLNKIQHL